MISKELLSEVLEINNINLILENENEINYTQYTSISRGTIDNYINIYELAYKCKIWAANKHFHIYSKSMKNKAVAKIRKTINGKHHKNTLCSFIANTEHEAIFLVGQWILENKDKSGKDDICLICKKMY